MALENDIYRMSAPQVTQMTARGHQDFCSVAEMLLLAALVLCSVVLVFCGVCTYNLFLHPYASYPGPFWARASPLYALWHAYFGDLHIDTLRCHQKYGFVVRYSPGRLVFNTTTATKAVYGSGRNFQKAKGYAAHPYFPGITNTHNTIDKTTHARKRRIVAQGFSETAMASSEQYILQHVRNFCDEMINPDTIGQDGWSQPRDMANWTNYFTLDVISDLTFGRAFNMIKKNELRWLVDAIVQGNRHIYIRFAYLPLFNLDPSKWYSPARWLFPNMPTERAKFSNILEQYTRERLTMMQESKIERKDIMSALLVARDPKTGEKLSDAEIWTEAHLMIAAGGDTTSTAFAAVLFYLSRNAECYSRLANEIRITFSDIELIRRGPLLRSCTYLRACLDEAMRLAPAAPGVLWREACAGGALVDGVHVPAGLDAGVSTYALSHNPEYFSDPFRFDPERFLRKDIQISADSLSSDDEGIDYNSRSTSLGPSEDLEMQRHDSDAFVPFSIGPRGCLAKPLAYLELSLALARMMFLMDFEAVGTLGEGGPGMGRGRERKQEFQIIDMFSSNKRGPMLRFRART